MTITITLKFTEDDDEFGRRLMQLLGEHGAVLEHDEEEGWTINHAKELIHELNSHAKLLLRACADGEGWVSGGEFREQHGDRALYGPTAAITKAVKRCIRNGKLPEGFTSPINPTYNPDNPSWQKTGGYTMTKSDAKAFAEAFAELDGQ
ncbi:hypothetical protein [Streptomyces roseoverticillatus]|uniref:hypothetical protein n=1 Tax=Streptomyces roseoverticillatus TaxID=66429 RepID=UPI0004C2AF19|nr:hypothetical protein [Streptomyces roseoverticillatus]